VIRVSRDAESIDSTAVQAAGEEATNEPTNPEGVVAEHLRDDVFDAPLGAQALRVPIAPVRT
jgi:hypothetical protein